MSRRAPEAPDWERLSQSAPVLNPRALGFLIINVLARLNSKALAVLMNIAEAQFQGVDCLCACVAPASHGFQLISRGVQIRAMRPERFAAFMVGGILAMLFLTRLVKTPMMVAIKMPLI